MIITVQVQIRPWRLSDSDYIMDHMQPIDARKTIFIGGVPRPLKACELADIFNSRYGNVCYAGIDCDPDLKYPKGVWMKVVFWCACRNNECTSCSYIFNHRCISVVSTPPSRCWTSDLFIPCELYECRLMPLSSSHLWRH